MSNIPTSLSFASMPPIGAPLEGGTFVGVTTKPDGTHVAVIRLPGNAKNVTWKQAQDWAAEQGGELPSRCEATLLFDHNKEYMGKGCYWTRDAETDLYAWCCGFHYGGWWEHFRMDCKFSAVAVRLIPIQFGEVVVTWDYDRTRILAVTRQNDDHQIVEVIAEAPTSQPPGDAREAAIPELPEPEWVEAGDFHYSATVIPQYSAREWAKAYGQACFAAGMQAAQASEPLMDRQLLEDARWSLTEMIEYFGPFPSGSEVNRRDALVLAKSVINALTTALGDSDE